MLLSCETDFLSRVLLQSENMVIRVGRLLPFYLPSEMKVYYYQFLKQLHNILAALAYSVQMFSFCKIAWQRGNNSSFALGQRQNSEDPAQDQGLAKGSSGGNCSKTGQHRPHVPHGKLLSSGRKF